jgi:hypothetical protein
VGSQLLHVEIGRRDFLGCVSDGISGEGVITMIRRLLFHVVRQDFLGCVTASGFSRTSGLSRWLFLVMVGVAFRIRANRGSQLLYHFEIGICRVVPKTLFWRW